MKYQKGKAKKRNSGISLAVVMVFIAMFLVLGISMMMASQVSLQQAVLSQRVNLMFYGAEGTVQRAAQEVRSEMASELGTRMSTAIHALMNNPATQPRGANWTPSELVAWVDDTFKPEVARVIRETYADIADDVANRSVHLDGSLITRSLVHLDSGTPSPADITVGRLGFRGQAIVAPTDAGIESPDFWIPQTRPTPPTTIYLGNLQPYFEITAADGGIRSTVEVVMELDRVNLTFVGGGGGPLDDMNNGMFENWQHLPDYPEVPAPEDVIPADQLYTGVDEERFNTWIRAMEIMYDESFPLNNSFNRRLLGITNASDVVLPELPSFVGQDVITSPGSWRNATRVGEWVISGGRFLREEPNPIDGLPSIRFYAPHANRVVSWNTNNRHVTEVEEWSISGGIVVPIRSETFGSFQNWASSLSGTADEAALRRLVVVCDQGSFNNLQDSWDLQDFSNLEVVLMDGGNWTAQQFTIFAPNRHCAIGCGCVQQGGPFTQGQGSPCICNENEVPRADPTILLINSTSSNIHGNLRIDNMEVYFNGSLTINASNHHVEFGNSIFMIRGSLLVNAFGTGGRVQLGSPESMPQIYVVGYNRSGSIRFNARGARVYGILATTSRESWFDYRRHVDYYFSITGIFVGMVGPAHNLPNDAIHDSHTSAAQSRIVPLTHDPNLAEDYPDAPVWVSRCALMYGRFIREFFPQAEAESGNVGNPRFDMEGQGNTARSEFRHLQNLRETTHG